jgi:hypothetical protein
MTQALGKVNIDLMFQLGLSISKQRNDSGYAQQVAHCRNSRSHAQKLMASGDASVRQDTQLFAVCSLLFAS